MAVSPEPRSIRTLKFRTVKIRYVRKLPSPAQNVQPVLFCWLYQGSEVMKSVGVCTEQYDRCGWTSWLHPLQAERCEVFHINSGRRLLQHTAWQYYIVPLRSLPSLRSPSCMRSCEQLRSLFMKQISGNGLQRPPRASNTSLTPGRCYILRVTIRPSPHPSISISEYATTDLCSMIRSLKTNLFSQHLQSGLPPL